MFNTKPQKIFISIILGFGIATLFRKVCEGRNCIIFEGPDVDEVEQNVYKYKEKCYKYKAKDSSCN